MSLIEEARKILREDVDPALYEKLSYRVRRGELEWRDDPVVEGVVGLLKPGTNQAVVVVYVTERDFEVADEVMDW